MIGNRRLAVVVRQGQRATAQTTLRWAIVLLLVLLVIAQRFGLDVVLGAMLAGMVLRSWTRRIDMDVARLEQKLDAVGYGIFIPLFFVASGMALDIRSIVSNPVRLLVFVALLLVHTATTLPLLVALAEIGQHDGLMLPSNAAAIVGAGVLSVLLFLPSPRSCAARDPPGSGASALSTEPPTTTAHA